MTEQSDWEAAFAPPGSSLYYSNLHLAPEKKHAFLALHALWLQLEEILHEATDPGVGRMKLQWWREEIERAFHGEARYPVAVVLARSFNCFAAAKQPFWDAINAVDLELSHAGHATFASLEPFLDQMGRLWGLSALIDGYRDEHTPEALKQLGSACELSLLIQNLPRDMARGRPHMPLDEAERAGVQLDQPVHANDSLALRRFVGIQAKRASERLQESLERLPVRDRLSQLHSLILGNIYHATLHEIAQDGFRVAEHHIALTPLRKLWIAWSTRRKETARSPR
ncbi:MAG: squalene/phytoene synthase family protein [Gammaproteobacteria bacterium]